MNSTTLTNVSEEEIKRIAQTNRRYASELVVHKYRAQLNRHASYILRDAQQGADLVQEVFIKALREQRFFNEDFRMRAWLFRVTSNLSLNAVRNRKRRGAILESISIPAITSPVQLDNVLRDEKREVMMEAIGTLSENHQTVLLKRFYLDLTYKEIGHELGLKVGTVMSRLSRAKRALTRVLEPKLNRST